MRVGWVIGFAAAWGVLAAAAAEDSSVRQQNRCRVITTVYRFGCHLGPDSSLWIPKLRYSNRQVTEIVEARTLTSPGHEHGPVRQEGGVMLPATELHRGHTGPRGIGNVEINDLHDVGS